MDAELRTEPTVSSVDLVSCSECREPAEVEWRDVAESTHGPVEHCKVHWVNRHRFLLPTENLSRP